MATFILNDETQVNSYGFRVLNAGLDLTRFKANPVLLNGHRDWDLHAVIGRWINIRIEGTQLLADSEFDMDDKTAAEIAGKVKRGFLKACSIGFLFNREFMVKSEVDGHFELQKSELMEGSIVAIGSNSKALVRLYASDTEELMSDEQVKLALSADSGIIDTQISKEDTMEKFKLSAPVFAQLAALGKLTDPEDASAVNKAIAEVCGQLTTSNASLEAEKKAHNKLKETLTAQIKTEAKTAIDAAVEAGKLTGSETEVWIEDYIANPERTKRALAAITGKANLSGAVIPTSGSDSKVKTIDDFEKLKIAEQLAFKSENPDDYAALFTS